MKISRLFFILLSLVLSQNLHSQVNGEIISEEDNLTVVKVWGSHAERGFAYGYLMAPDICSLYNDYIASEFGFALPLAKSIIEAGEVLEIDSLYIIEAKSMYEGIIARGYSITNGNYLDILVANTFLDLIGVNANFGSPRLKNGCSSLMTWGDATTGTTDEGKSFVSRHLDWELDPALINNHIIVIHNPSEDDEQPWALIGFTGMMSALSGVNSEGLAVFQHMLSDFSGTSMQSNPYCPIWFAGRRALEKKDYNKDGNQDVNDIRSSLEDSENGFTEGYIIAALAKNNQSHDSLVALVAELAPNSPTHTFRYNNYPDSIPGDNLYAANYEIKRNAHMHFCSRYNNIKSSFSDSVGISLEDNWNKIRDYSNSSTNLQLMQFCPEDLFLKLSYYKNDSTAYMREPVEFDLAELFEIQSSAIERNFSKKNNFILLPNPATDEVFLEISNIEDSEIEVVIYNMNLQKIMVESFSARRNENNIFRIDISFLEKGIYFFNLRSSNLVLTKKFAKI